MAGTTREFEQMLNEYLTYELLKEEIDKRNFLINKVDKDLGWRGGAIPVPFKAARASSIRYGGLTEEKNISQSKYIRGRIDEPGEMWGSLVFNERDLSEHSGATKEKSFLNRLTDEIDSMIDLMSSQLSINILAGNAAGYITTTARGNTSQAEVSNPEHLEIGQVVTIKSDEGQATVTIDEIDVNESKIKFSPEVPSSTNAIKKGAKVFISNSGGDDNKFVSFRSQLLSASSGGSDTLFGCSKSKYPYLQALEFDGSGINQDNILDTIFDAFIKARKIGKGNANSCVLSYAHGASIMKKLERESGPYRHVGTKASLYGYETITITGAKGKLDFSLVPEMADDLIYMLDWRGIKLHSNNMFQVRKSPEGQKYHVIRTTEGYRYIVDIVFSGQIVVNRPSYQAVIRGIKVQ